MAKSMKGLSVAILVLAAGFLRAQALGTFLQVSGKVEQRRPGGAWVAVKKGDAVAKGAVVSVGFKSSAVVKTADATITVKALTRLTIEDIVKTAGGTKTELYLSSGRVRTEVTPAAGEKAEFKVKSPTSTASVRGTGFEFDGVNLVVDHGSVNLSTAAGRSRRVGAGRATSVSSRGDVRIPVDLSGGLDAAAEAASRLDREEDGTNIDATGDFLGKKPSADSGSVTVIIPID